MLTAGPQSHLPRLALSLRCLQMISCRSKSALVYMSVQQSVTILIKWTIIQRLAVLFQRIISDISSQLTTSVPIKPKYIIWKQIGPASYHREMDATCLQILDYTRTCPLIFVRARQKKTCTVGLASDFRYAPSTHCPPSHLQVIDCEETSCSNVGATILS